MKNTLLILPFLALLAACGTSGSSKNIIVEDRNPEVIARETSSFEWQDSSKSAKNSANFSANSIENIALTELKSSAVEFVLYFSYDGFDIDEATTQEIIKHANFMRDNPKIDLRLEGHADERGTREYNLALGENRAISVKEVLGLYQGLSARVQVVSYGEENPVAAGHNESAWAKNRRVEFIYQPSK
ncbi:MAG: OmpA family protein [Candidatus Thioglobus sp.]|nr:OmpA family protein [Candidatus Thioglobus sp.]